MPNVDAITKSTIERARNMSSAGRFNLIEKLPTPELIKIHAALLGEPKPKTPAPVLRRRIIEALANPASKPLDEALSESPSGAANAASWDAAIPEPGYVPPAGTGDASADTGDDDALAAGAPPTPAPDAPAAAGGVNVGAPAATPARARKATTQEPAPARERDPRIPPIGTVIIKADRQGAERARCTIVEGGVEYAGTTYKSISAAAMAAAKALLTTTVGP